jgi:hypothetical protein
MISCSAAEIIVPIQVEFIRENRAVLQTYIDPLVRADLIASQQIMIRDIFPRSVDKLPIIVDFRRVNNLPSMVLKSSSVMMRTAHPNTGHIICVTRSAFVTKIAHVFAKLSPQYPVKVVQTLEEAYREVDALLAN